jgi:hypothetical protein
MPSRSRQTDIWGIPLLEKMGGIVHSSSISYIRRLGGRCLGNVRTKRYREGHHDWASLKMNI